jgi:hypothetical protein
MNSKLVVGPGFDPSPACPKKSNQFHHRDTEDAEIRSRRFLLKSRLSALCVSVVKLIEIRSLGRRNAGGRGASLGSADYSHFSVAATTTEELIATIALEP